MTMQELISQSDIVNAELFAKGLDRALNTVVLVTASTGAGETSCTGWMVTPRLVVLPAYAIASIDTVEGGFVPVQVSLQRHGAVVWHDVADRDFRAEIIQGDSTSDPLPPMDLALLRLRQEHEVPAQVFRERPSEPSLSIVIAHRGHHSNSAHGTGLSFGRLSAAASGTALHYHGANAPGSGGAPIFDLAWQFVGIHFLSTPDGLCGLSRSAVMGMLQRSQWWSDIARYQGLADVVAVRQADTAVELASTAASPILLLSALSFKVERESLTEPERVELAGHVVDLSAPHWTMKPKARQNILRDAGPLKELLRYLPADPDSPEQRVVAPILRGPPYSLDGATLDDLSRWLQAVRWFGDLAPGLPTPVQVNRLLLRRRIRGRLKDLAGDDFIGRELEMKKMRLWFNSQSRAPLNVSGVGGVGKSALVAHFAASLPDTVMLLWLDFDRATLMPDDACSVVAALLHEAVPQLDEADTAHIPDAREDLDGARAALVRLLNEAAQQRRTLIVLDSFEAAQYAERYQELWPELERLGKTVDALQVIVAGRVPLLSLKLSGKLADNITLRGLAPDDAREWLGNHKVTDRRVQDEVIRVSGGLPLVLKLAEQLMLAGGKLADLPKNLPNAMIAGVLYDRILDRVHNAEFKEVAKGAVVLRRFTAEMIKPIFDRLLTLPAGEPADWFRQFAREAALVEGQAELRLRPEVRTAALALLEREDPELVGAIDRRAIAWYESQDRNDPAMAAELVYHLLRVADVVGASAAWRDGCAVYLQYAEEMLHGLARGWLMGRIGTSASIHQPDVEVWEAEAADRIKRARSRGKSLHAPGIFKERADRSQGGALAFHEAYEYWRHGERDLALELLAEHDNAVQNPQARERAMLAALIHAAQGDRREALQILRVWSAQERWSDRSGGATECAAVQAARVCLSADLINETRVARRASHRPDLLSSSLAFGQFLVPMDVLQPSSRRRLESVDHKASIFQLQLGNMSNDPQVFLGGMDHFRRTALGNREPLALRQLRQTIFNGGFPEPASVSGLSKVHVELLTASWMRWATFAGSGMVDLLRRVLDARSLSPLEESVVTVLALFAYIPNLELQVLPSVSLERALHSLESRMLYPAGYTMHAQHLPDPGLQLRRLALSWCRGSPRPLQQLVELFAGTNEEGSP